MPVKVVIQPAADGKSNSEIDERRAVVSLIENQIGLIGRNVNQLRVRRNNFDISAIIHYLLLRSGLQITQIISRGPQPLD